MSSTSVGTMKWQRDRWRRWSGLRWASATHSIHPERLRSRIPLEQDVPISGDQRERILAKAVDDEVLGGARVVHRSGQGVILGYQRKINHLGHFLMTLVTGGLWGFVWVALVATRKEERVRLDVDAWGNVWPVAGKK
ncbi:hypothetical protein NOCA2210079 [metagenome]|uniref:Uncharacterized protein n=1 Tax=metagenome TaxID=256318 RepID=A0A2P2BYA3_9ZZZZ